MAAIRTRPTRAARRAGRPAAPPSTRRVRRRSALDTVEAAIVGGVLLFLLGGYWDVAWHLEIGRDTFWSPPHLLLYAGVLGVLGSSAYALVRAWRVRRGPPGPAPFIAAIGGALSIASAPIDDLWHRLYGLDVTILSPPHIMLISGMAVAAFGALAGYTRAADRRDPGRLATVLRSTAGRWAAAGQETGIVVAAGILLTTVVAVLGEYDFDVSRYPVAWHPVLLASLAAFVLSLALRALGRAGGATLAAAAYVGVRTAAHAELTLFDVVRPHIPLVFPAAVAIDLVVLAASGRGVASKAAVPRWAPPLAGACFAVLLLALQGPYTAAFNDLVWTPAVLAVSALPSVAGAAILATAGWLLGAVLHPVRAPAPGPRGSREAATPRWNGWTGRSGIAVVAAAVAVLLLGIAPAAARGGAPPVVSSAARPGREVVGYLQLDPAVPVAGQPLTLRLALNDLSFVGVSPALPYESVRAGDVTSGVLRATAERGVYSVTITPREPGRRWLSAFLEGEEGRVAASAMFVVYRPGEAARLPANAPGVLRAVVLRPEPGPELDLPPWLEPAVYGALAILLGGAAVAVTYALRSGQAAPAGAPGPPVPEVRPAQARV